jgi:hypothetical protein
MARVGVSENPDNISAGFEGAGRGFRKGWVAAPRKCSLESAGGKRGDNPLASGARAGVRSQRDRRGRRGRGAPLPAPSPRKGGEGLSPNGEAVAVDAQGKASFQMLQNRFSCRRVGRWPITLSIGCTLRGRGSEQSTTSVYQRWRMWKNSVPTLFFVEDPALLPMLGGTLQRGAFRSGLELGVLVIRRV